MMNRRDFLKLSATGLATLVLSRSLPGLGVANAYAADQSLKIFITDALKEMVTHNQINDARCYFWIYRMEANGQQVPPDCPGPTIVALKGDTISVEIKNELDEPHSFYIPGIFDSGPIAPGDTFIGTLTASVSGAHMYYDNLNEPVNRVMGLHGALVVRPTSAVGLGNNITPYDNPTPNVQKLYNDFGKSVDAFGRPMPFPGLAWHEGDVNTLTPPFRQYVWITHQASPKLFAEVGDFQPGQDYPAQQFLNKFLRSPFDQTRATSFGPEYFTINGQSGFFAHASPQITPIGRVGEPVVVHILNAGLWSHAMHLHANHFFVTSVNGVPSENPIWVDVFGLFPMDRVDYTIPFMRPPDIPNQLGLGLSSTPLMTISDPQKGLISHPCYPPTDELDLHFPKEGTTTTLDDQGAPVPILDINGDPLDIKQRQSPLCYPMHDHTEPSQTAQGGNYNCGLIAGINFIGDRNIPGHMNFPMDADFAMMFRNIRGISGVAGESATYPAAGLPPA